MKKTAAFFTALILASSLVTAVGCSDKKKTENSSGSFASAEYQEPESGAKPVLSISNSEGHPGETVEVKVFVSGAKYKWAMCGVHFAYPMVLDCRTAPNDERFADFTKGEASSRMTAFTAATWKENRTGDMEKNEQYSLFFAAMSDTNSGGEGEIATFYLTIPEDAVVGTVYPLEFFEIDGDMFLDAESDMNLQSYAFSNWQNGSITVI